MKKTDIAFSRPSRYIGRKANILPVSIGHSGEAYGTRGSASEWPCNIKFEGQGFNNANVC